MNLYYTLNNRRFVIASNLIPNHSFDLGNVYKENNAFYFYQIKTNQQYTNKDTLFYDIVSKSTLGMLDSAYKFAVGPFYNGAILDSTIATIPVYKGKENKTVFYTKWVLKSNDSVYAANRHQEGVIIPCKKYSDVVFDISQ